MNNLVGNQYHEKALLMWFLLVLYEKSVFSKKSFKEEEALII